MRTWLDQERERRMQLFESAYDLFMATIDVFTEHPASIGESWVEHARLALSISGLLAGAALAAAVHAVVPALFETTASRTIDRLHVLVHGSRGAGAAMIDSVEAIKG